MLSRRVWWHSLLAVSLFSSLMGTLFATEKRTEEIFKLCAACHGDHAEGKQSVDAPAIAGLPAWYIESQLHKFIDGVRGESPKDFAGMHMRPMARALKPYVDTKAIAEYVSKMKKPKDLPATVKGSWARGESRYQVCAACHGANGEGMEAVQAPPLVGQNDWYLLKQLENFKHKIRGYDATKDPLGVAMGGMAAGLDEQSMKDIVSYLRVIN